MIFAPNNTTLTGFAVVTNVFDTGAATYNIAVVCRKSDGTNLEPSKLT